MVTTESFRVIAYSESYYYFALMQFYNTVLLVGWCLSSISAMKQTTTITSSVSKGTEKEDPTKMKNGIKTPIPAVGAKIVGDPA